MADNGKQGKEVKPAFINRTVGKGELKKRIAWAFTNCGTTRTAQMADQLKTLGFRYATQAGVSISVEDLQVPPEKRELLETAEREIEATETRFVRGEITEVERFQKVIDTWHLTNERLKNQVLANFRENNPLNSVYMMANSGARGNVSQVRQLVGMRGLMADPQGEIIDQPIKTNFREGLTVTEYIISSYGARKGLVDTALRTADSGYLTRRLVDVSQDVIVRESDCGTDRGIVLRAMRDGDRTTIKLSDRLFGRLAAEAVLDPRVEPVEIQLSDLVGSNAYAPEEDIVCPKTGEVLRQRHQTIYLERQTDSDREREAKLAELARESDRPIRARKVLVARNQPMDDTLSKLVDKAGVEEVRVRSALTCESNRSVCQTCYGWSLAHGTMVDIGEAVGIIAAQSIGEPGTQLTMRTFHTGGVFTGEVAEQLRAPFAGILKVKKTRLRPHRTRHGEDAFIVEANSEMTLEGENGQKEVFPLPQGTVLMVEHGSKVVAKQMLAEVASSRAARKTTEKATKELIADIAGETVFEDLLPEERKDRQGNTSYIATRNGRIWVMAAEVYNLLPGAEAVVRNGDRVNTGDIIAENRLISEHGGIVRLHPEDHHHNREVEIITASVVLDRTRVIEESHQGREHYILETAQGQRFSLKATPGTKVINNQVVADLIDATYHTKTGGIVKYADDLEVSKRGKAKQGYEVVKGGTLLWIPEEVHEVNKDSSLLMVENGQFVEAGTEVVKDIFCHCDGIVEVTEKNDILRELTVKPGELHLIDDPDWAMQRHETLVPPGTEVVPGVTYDDLRYLEFVEGTEGPALLARPVEEFRIPDEPMVPSQESSQQSGRSICLRAVQRLPYKDGERVKSIDGVELLRTQLVLEIDSEAAQLVADIELVPDEDGENQRLQLAILESLTIRQDTGSETVQSNVRTRLLVDDGDEIGPGAVVARTEILCRQSGEVQGIREAGEAVRRIALVTDENRLVVPCASPSVAVKDFVRAGDRLGKHGKEEVLAKDSGQVLAIEGGNVILRRGRPYLVSPGAVIQVGDRDLVQRGDSLSLLVFERAKTGDIIQGLPRIEELLEGRKPKEKCVLAQKDGEVRISHREDDSVSVSLVENDGTITPYEIGVGQSLLVSDGQQVKGGEPLTDGPRDPHEILDIYFQLYRLDAECRGVALLEFLDTLEAAIEDPALLRLRQFVATLPAHFSASQRYQEVFTFLSTDGEGMPLLRVLDSFVNKEAALRSLQKVQELLVDEVQRVYQSQGVDISDKHIEVVVKQMTSKVRIDDGGETTRLPGELVDLNQVDDINIAMAITRGVPAEYTPVLMGITKASLNTDSFISAASFQETTRVLTEAAIEGKSDWLRGLKENVIIGRLIPAGTGFNAYDNAISDPVVDDDENDVSYGTEWIPSQMVPDVAALEEGPIPLRPESRYRLEEEEELLDDEKAGAILAEVEDDLDGDLEEEEEDDGLEEED